MRQLFLVVVLVAASFLGGAFVNGPGLQWAQARLQRSLGLNQADEIALVDIKPMVTAEPNFSASSSSAMPNKPTAETFEAPLAPVPSSQTESDSEKQDTSDRPSKPASRLSLIGGQPPSQGLQSSSSWPAQRPLPRNRSGDRSVSQLDTTVTPVVGVPPTDSSPRSSQSKSNSVPASLDSLSALLPANLPPSANLALSSPSDVPSPKSSASGNDTWSVLERKMQSLGVVRYTMDGEPGGRVVFSCLIPLAGRQAITQRFEAEGDDIIHAVQAALRRITLWRATQPSPP